MKIAALHSHLNGHEWMLVHRPRIWREIERAIAGVDAQRLRTKVSREIRKKGRALHSPRAMNREFTRVFRALGWRESRTSY